MCRNSKMSFEFHSILWMHTQTHTHTRPELQMTGHFFSFASASHLHRAPLLYAAGCSVYVIQKSCQWSSPIYWHRVRSKYIHTASQSGGFIRRVRTLHVIWTELHRPPPPPLIYASDIRVEINGDENEWIRFFFLSSSFLSCSVRVSLCCCGTHTHTLTRRQHFPKKNEKMGIMPNWQEMLSIRDDKNLQQRRSCRPRKIFTPSQCVEPNGTAFVPLPTLKCTTRRTRVSQVYCWAHSNSFPCHAICIYFIICVSFITVGIEMTYVFLRIFFPIALCCCFACHSLLIAYLQWSK